MSTPTGSEQAHRSASGDGRTGLRARWAAASPGARTVAVVVIVLLAVAAGTISRYQRPAPLTISPATLTVGGPPLATVTFDVRKAPLAEAGCTVLALGPDGAEIGRAVTRVPGNDAGRRVTPITVQVPVPVAATGARVHDCALTRTH
ncbi:MAG: hypothetical protein JWM48_433 [Mycobacterium sp.]|nr:hypothetical protein [Mycobacterium sp.]